jgi:hypothetical protein
MKRQIEFGALAVLLVVLGYMLLNRFYPAQTLPGISPTVGNYTPLAVEDPALRTDLLQHIREFEYSGRHRNIFSPNLPPPALPPGGVTPGQPPAVVVPSGPPPLEVPVKFFGYSSDPRSGRRRAFFTDGDDVFIASEGDTVLNRFRILHIGNSSVDVLEIASGRRATLNLEELPPS